MTDQPFQTPVPTLEALPQQPNQYNLPHFAQVVFGHSYRDFDIDQLGCFIIGIELGLIDTNTHFIFGRVVEDSQLSDPSALVLEGYKGSRPGGDTKLQGKATNFLNGPQDQPATFMLYSQYRHLFDNPANPRLGKLKQFVLWLNNVEQGKYQQAETEPNHQLFLQLRQIFHALKNQYTQINQSGQLLSALGQLFDKWLSSEEISIDSLKQDYLQALADHQTSEQNSWQRLNEQVKTEPQRLKVQTAGELRVGIIDVSGIDAARGGFAVLDSYVNSTNQGPLQLQMLISDVLSDDGSKLGTKLLIKIPETTDSSILQALATKLNIQEMQFGWGYGLLQITDFGGHKGIIGTPGGIGTKLEAPDLVAAIINFLQVPRQPASSFERLASGQLITAGYPNHTFNQPSSSSQFELPESTIEITIADKKVISLTEQDWFFYQQVLTQNPELNLKQLLEQKNGLDEHIEVAKVKREFGRDLIKQALTNNDVHQALTALEYLVSDDFELIDSTNLLKLFELISRNDKAIDQLYNPVNNRFRILNPVPNWMDKDQTAYGRARYTWNSVPQKLHSFGLNRLVKLAKENPNQDNQIRTDLINTLLRLINVQKFSELHQLPQNDNVLASLIELSLTPIDPTSNSAYDFNKLKQDLINLCNDQNRNLWSGTIVNNSGLVTHFMSKIPSEQSGATDWLKGLFSNKINLSEQRTYDPAAGIEMLTISEQQLTELPANATVNLLFGLGEDIEQTWKDHGVDGNKEEQYHLVVKRNGTIDTNDRTTASAMYSATLKQLELLKAKRPDLKVNITLGRLNLTTSMGLGFQLGSSNLKGIIRNINVWNHGRSTFVADYMLTSLITGASEES